MSRLTQAVVLVLFGGAILRASLTDLYLRYVKEGLRPFLIGAGLVLVAAAAYTIMRELRGPAAPAHQDQPDHEGHPGEADRGEPDHHDVPAGAELLQGGGDHDHHEPRVGWLLVLPVLGLVLVAPPALGAYTAGQTGSVTATAPGSDYPSLPAGDPAPVSLLDYASRSLLDDGRSLTGRSLRLTGFVTPGPDGQPMLARIVLTCCAADGRPIKVGLVGHTPIDVPADTWIEVVGVHTPRVGKDPVNGVEVAYLEVRSWQEITQPEQPYA